jgi:transcriptional regulator with XRE-family HTH domain
LIDRVESRRRERGLSQAVVAASCGMTQGHYSKLARGRVPPGARARDALRGWLDSRDRGPGSSRGSARLRALAESIRRDCAELARLAGLEGS